MRSALASSSLLRLTSLCHFAPGIVAELHTNCSFRQHVAASLRSSLWSGQEMHQWMIFIRAVIVGAIKRGVLRITFSHRMFVCSFCVANAISVFIPPTQARHGKKTIYCRTDALWIHTKVYCGNNLRFSPFLFHYNSSFQSAFSSWIIILHFFTSETSW